MKRRLFIRNGLLSATGLFSLLSGIPLSAAEPINYDRLMATLYPKTEGEKKFLKDVVDAVQKKKLPEKMVYAAWRFAEDKQKAKRVRYFAETLAILCKRSGTKLTVKLNP